MTTELMLTRHAGKVVAAKVQLDQRRMRAEDYDQLYALFTVVAGITESIKRLQMFTLYPDQHKWGIWWVESLCPDGCRFTLICEPHVSHGTHDAVRRELKNKRDVKSFTTIRIDRWIELPPLKYHDPFTPVVQRPHTPTTDQ